MTPEPERDAENARLMSSGLVDASVVGALLLIVMWPIVRVLSRVRLGLKRS